MNKYFYDWGNYLDLVNDYNWDNRENISFP